MSEESNSQQDNSSGSAPTYIKVMLTGFTLIALAGALPMVQYGQAYDGPTAQAVVQISLILTNNNLRGRNQFHVQVWAYHRAGITKEFTILRTANIEERTEYVGNPSLLDKLLRRAEKRSVGPAEYIVRTAMEAAKTKTMQFEADLHQGFDPEEFNHQIETVFPVSTWADVPDDSESSTSQTRQLVADGGRDIQWCDWCQHRLHEEPEYRVHGQHVTAYCCSPACAKAWRASNSGDIVRASAQVRADGGTDSNSSRRSNNDE